MATDKRKCRRLEVIYQQPDAVQDDNLKRVLERLGWEWVNTDYYQGERALSFIQKEKDGTTPHHG